MWHCKNQTVILIPRRIKNQNDKKIDSHFDLKEKINENRISKSPKLIANLMTKEVSIYFSLVYLFSYTYNQFLLSLMQKHDSNWK